MSTDNSPNPQPKGCSARKGCALGCFMPMWYFIAANTLPLLYTPPALTEQKRATYAKVTAYVTAIKKKHNLEDAMLDRFGRLEVFRNNAWIDENKVLSRSEIRQGLNLCEELEAVHCRNARSEGDMMLFHPMVSNFLPHPPGVLYSIGGRDPNLTDQPRLQRFRPFQKLDGNWYSSMNMRPSRFSGW